MAPKGYRDGSTHNTKSTTNLLLFLTTIALIISNAQCCPLKCTCETTKVNCAGQGLTSLPPDLPKGMTDLDFSNNKLTSLGSEAFSAYNATLSTLNLSGNKISTILYDTFHGLTKLRELYLQRNELRNFPNHAFKYLEKVTSMDLSYNPLDGFPTDVFEDCYRLSTLKMIEVGFDQNAFQHMKILPLLNNLDISGNRFTKLPYLMMSSNSRLTHVTINNASIENIDPNAFVGLDSLTHLRLADNKISHLNRETFQILSALSYLDLSENPLICDCGTANFKDWKRFQGVSLVDSPKCAGSDGQTYNIDSLDLDKFCNEQEPSCSANSKVRLQAKEIGSDLVVVSWQAHSLGSDSKLSVNLRLYGDGIKSGLDHWQAIGFEGVKSFTGLKAGSQYALCIMESKCGVYVCMDFTTTEPGVGAVRDPMCISTEATAGIAAAAAFATLVFGLTTVYLILRGVCCCPGKSQEDYTPPDTPTISSEPSKRTQHVVPMQLSQSYIPTSNVLPSRVQPRKQSSSSIGDTYDAIPLEPVEIDPSGKIFYNPSYRRKERPRHANDPLPNPESNSTTDTHQMAPSLGMPRSETPPQVIQGISSTYLHPTLEDQARPSSRKVPDTYLEPTDTFPRASPSRSSKRADPTQRHTMNNALSTSDPYHVYQEAMDDIEPTLTLRPRSSDNKSSPFATNKLPSLDDIRKQMEAGTGRLKKFRRPEKQNGAGLSTSTPDILSADIKTGGQPHGQSEA